MARLSFILGTMVCVVFLFATLVASPAQTLETLVNFDTSNGGDPYYGPLVQGTNGKIYGTTVGGPTGWGTVFAMAPGGELTTLYEFCSAPGCVDGANPKTGVIQALDGNFYGTAMQGGANGQGVVYSITPTGEFTTLYSFCSLPSCADGAGPIGSLIQGNDHNLYGTTSASGVNGGGTIFKITPTGTLTTLYNFCALPGCADGGNPYGGLVQANDGNFYGATLGTVYQLTPGGTFTVLYAFCPGGDCSTGALPLSSLVQSSNGNLWGTASYGGEGDHGAVYQITLSGTLTAYSVCSHDTCVSREPTSSLVQTNDGKLYGTGFIGGEADAGAIFSVTPTGAMRSLYSFCSLSGCADGTNPAGGLMQDTNGILYGTTLLNGTGGVGTIFGFSVGLGPFVETRPGSGAVGTPVAILGTDLTGATGVSFNGIPATFTVVSASEIRTTVPSGATTGIVTVTTPSGPLNSNTSFQVVP
jgi:uncharacterized repeat protein (TIGR03803 family)